MKDHVLVQDGRNSRWCPEAEYKANPARFTVVSAAKPKAKPKAKAAKKDGV